jgi:hypothetical protein
LTAALAALSLAVLAILPAEHIHLPVAHQHPHDAALIHRHYEPHHATHSTKTITDRDDDHEVRWVASVFTIQPISHAGPAVAPVASYGAGVPPEALPATLFVSPAESAHDPPWAVEITLRGPPSFSL